MSEVLNEFDRVTAVAMKRPLDAFTDVRTIQAQWKELNYSAPPDLARATAEYDRFVELVTQAGAEVSFLPADRRTGLDSIYVRDASILGPNGIVLASMGKSQRAGEPEAQGAAFAALEIPVAGAIQRPGTVEGGDLVWLDSNTLAVGEGYRTNADGIRQLRALLGRQVEVITVPLPHWRGADEVLHLMSLISPVDRDLAVVYSPLMPVPFRKLLLQRGYTLIDVPDDEFETMGANVLALAPRRCIMLTGNPRTRSALERTGARVDVYEGIEISIKGAGGPTCLTRPLARHA